MQNKYELQAKEFLKNTQTEMAIRKLGLSCAPWQDQEKHRPVNAFYVTLKNKRHEYSFIFYTSLHDTYGPELSPRQYQSTWNIQTDKRKHAAKIAKKDYTYDVLACLQIDYTEDFEDFCNSYGYDTDSRQALKTWEAVRNETKNLKLLFNEKELELLHDIC